MLTRLTIKIATIRLNEMGDFLDTMLQQTYQVNPLLSQLRKQRKTAAT